jgi:hypothetical protein
MKHPAPQKQKQTTNMDPQHQKPKRATNMDRGKETRKITVADTMDII